MSKKTVIHIDAGPDEHVYVHRTGGGSSNGFLDFVCVVGGFILGVLFVLYCLSVVIRQFR